ncbi:MAG: hypothetical protein E7084_02600 [Bacteroidales bacterium]|nr:hypothetical protein [Bacteroidales bacterium]
MKKLFIISALTFVTAISVCGQGVLDALPAISSQTKGTARYSAMAGAFGALGGDLTSIKQNPAGIGVYRFSELTVTAGFNFTDNTVSSPSRSNSNNEFYFTGDNMGVVGVINFREGSLRNLNFGFAYNNIASFNNTYRADWNNISSSLTQLIASQASGLGCTPDILDESGSSNPYNDLPWLPVLGYNTNLIYPINAGSTNYVGIFDYQQSRGDAYLINYTSGGIDEYDFNISGNVSDVLYWGLTLNVTNIDYRQESYYGEELQNVNVKDNRNLNGRTSTTNGHFELQNYLRTDGYGTGVKIGLIYRPISFLRLGIAYHSPTYYTMTDTYSASVDYKFDKVDGRTLSGNGNDLRNKTDLGNFSYKFSSPWHLLGSIATVIGKSAIVSIDYELTATPDMQYSSPYIDYHYTNQCINNQSTPIHNVRIGAEYRITPLWSIRAGYAFESSPMKNEYFDGVETPQIVEGTIAHYQVPGDVHNISCGVGFRINNINVDAAYVYRMQDSRIFAFEGATVGFNPTIMNLHNNSIKLTLGYRF